MVDRTGPTIAVFTKNRTNPAYTAARLGAERTAARHGARVVHYVPQKPDDVEQQAALVEQAIAERPDAAVFVPVHVTAMDESVRKLNAARIPVVNILNRMERGEFVSFVGSDDYGLAREIAAHLFRHIGGKGEVAIIEGIAAAVTATERLRGFRDISREWPDIRIVASRSGDFQHGPAKQVAAGLLAEFPRLAGILSANDLMSLGAIEALEAAGRRIPIIGVNAVPEAIAAIKSGKLLATVDFDAMKIACVATEAAFRHLRGEAVPRHIELPVQVVHGANYQPWDRPFEERECPRWEDVVKEEGRR
jgi:ribose transport system substrate-binding protein